MGTAIIPQEAPEVTQIVARKCYAYDELSSMMEPTNQPYELWDGELIMSPSPHWNHQEITFRFGRELFDWVTERDLGKVVLAPIDMVLSPHCSVQPDVAFIARDNSQIIQDVIRGAADLVVEVVSPWGRQRDRFHKKDLYEQHGIKEYWIVDPESRTVDVFILSPHRLYELSGRYHTDETAQSTLLPGFALRLPYLFDGRV